MTRASSARSAPATSCAWKWRSLRASRGIWKFKARGSVDGETAVEAELMCTMRKSAE